MKARKRLERLAKPVVDERMCLVTVIGHRLTTSSGHSFAHPDCPPIVVHAIGVGFAAPTAEQEQEVVRLWLSGPGAPDAYHFPNHRLPAFADGCAPLFTPEKETSREDATDTIG